MKPPKSEQISAAKIGCFATIAAASIAAIGAYINRPPNPNQNNNVADVRPPGVINSKTSDSANNDNKDRNMQNNANEIPPSENAKSQPQIAHTNTRTPTPTPTSTPVPSTAWHGEYFHNERFQGPPAYERDDAEIAFEWGRGSPAPNVEPDFFSVRWTKCEVFEGRYYTFNLEADDKIRLYLGRVLIFPEQGRYDFLMPSGEHCLKVEFIELKGRAKASVSYN